MNNRHIIEIQSCIQTGNRKLPSKSVLPQETYEGIVSGELGVREAKRKYHIGYGRYNSIQNLKKQFSVPVATRLVVVTVFVYSREIPFTAVEEIRTGTIGGEQPDVNTE